MNASTSQYATPMVGARFYNSKPVAHIGVTKDCWNTTQLKNAVNAVQFKALQRV